MSNTTSGSIAVREIVPYKELDFFEEADRTDFAGRARDIDELIARIRITRAVVLYGRSGLGKTSLLRAGIFPLLREERYLPIYIRTLDSPLDDLAGALRDPLQVRPITPEVQMEENVEQVLARVSAWEKRVPVLVFDQFEEFFTRFTLRREGVVERQRRRNSFINRICNLVLSADQDVRIVFSLREDFLHTLDAFQRKVPDLFTHAYRLLPLTASGAREAIVAPLLRDNISFDECFVTELVDDLAEFDFESAHLQVACAEAYRAALRAQRQGQESSNHDLQIRDEDLAQIRDEKTKSLRGIFKNYLQAGIDNIPAEQHLLARQLLDQLFLSKGTKYALELEKLKELRFGTVEETETVLNNLNEQKLLRAPEIDGKRWFELRHECLVEPIEEWLNEHEGFAKYRLVRDIIRANAKGGRFREQSQLLLSEEQLGHVSDNKERFRLESDERELVFLSSMRHCSPDVVWWADQIGREKAKAFIIRALAEGSSEPMQRGAAEAAAQLGPPFDAAARLAGELALSASDESTRQAARHAFAVLADEPDLRLVAQKVRLFGTSQLLRDLLADLYEQDRMRMHFSLLRRCLARRRWQKRRFDANIRMIRECGSAGLIAGLSTTGLWLATCGLFIGTLAWGALRPELASTRFLAMFGIVGSVMLVVGAVCGYFLGRSAGQVSAVQASVPIAKAVCRSKVIGLIFGAAGPWALYLISDAWRDALWNAWAHNWDIAEFSSSFLNHEWIRDAIMKSAFVAIHVVAFLASAWVGRRFLSLLARFTRGAIWENSAKRSILFLASLAATILLPVLSLASRAEFFRRQSEICAPLLLVAMTTVIVLSCLLAVAVASLLEAERFHHRSQPQQDKYKRRRCRALQCGAIAAIAAILLVFGADTFPLPLNWLQGVQQDGERLLVRATFWVWPDSAIFSVKNEKWLLMHVASDDSLSLGRYYRSPTFVGDQYLWADWIFAPGGRARLAMRSNFPIASRQLTLENEPVSLTGEVRPTTNRWQLAILDMQLAESSAGPAQWVGTLHCKIDEAVVKSGDWIKVALLEVVSSEYSDTAVVNLREFTSTNLEANSVLFYPDRERLYQTTLEELSARRHNNPSRPEDLDAFRLERELQLLDYEDIRRANRYGWRRGGQSVTVRRVQGPITEVQIVEDAGAGRFKSASLLLAVCVEPKAGTFSSAMNTVRERVAAEPSNLEALSDLSLKLIKYGEFSQSIGVAETLANMSKDPAKVWDSVAKELYRVRQWKDAILAWEKTIQLEPAFFVAEDADSVRSRQFFEDAKRQIRGASQEK